MNSSTQSQAAQHPVIAGHEITTDEHGRFNLNAIHRASEAGRQKRPSYWLATKQAKELIAEVKSQTTDSWFGDSDQDKNSCLAPIHAYHGGATPGTFAHELLAVSYAGWISPKFQLQVNQVFLDYRMGNLQASLAGPQKALPSPLTPAHQRGIQKAISRRAQALPKPIQRTAYSRIYSHLKDRFEVGSYKDIDESRYTEALGAVESVSLEGYLMPEEPPQEGVTLSPMEAQYLYLLIHHSHWVHKVWHEFDMYSVLRALRSPAAARMVEHMSSMHDFKTRLSMAKIDDLLEARRSQGIVDQALQYH